MSSIFGAVRKSSLVRIDELESGQAASSLLRDQAEKQEQLSDFSTRLAGAAGIRTLPVRVEPGSPVFPFTPEHQEAGEQYRLIRTKILHSTIRPQMVMISSPSRGDGKTITSINLVAALALRAEQPVLLMDCDLRRPRVDAELNLPVAPGLSDVLAGTSTLDAALIRCEQLPQLYVLSAGGPLANPAELLESTSWRALLREVRARFSTVIVDAPPMAIVADSDLIQLAADGVILVMRPNHSDRRAVQQVLKSVPKDKFLGVVLNDVDDWWFWKAPAYGYYRPDARYLQASKAMASELLQKECSNKANG